MPLTERSEIDQIVLNPQTGYVGWRTSTIIERDGVEISRAYHRNSIEADYADFPGAPSPPSEVETHRALVQTPAKVAQARAKREESARRMGPPGG